MNPEYKRKILWYLKLIVTIIIAFEFVYLIAGNGLLATGALKTALNRHPEKRSYSWSSAYTYLPGWVIINDYSMRMIKPKVEWSAVVDKATVHIQLLPFLMRTFRMSYCSGSGVIVRINRIKAPELEKSIEPDMDPVNQVIDSTDVRTQPRQNGKKPWHIQLDAMVFSSVREIHFDDYCLTGDGLIEGSLDSITRSTLHAWDMNLAMEAAVLTLNGVTIADNLSVRIDPFEIGPYVPSENRGKKAFEFIRAAGLATGELSRLDFLQYYLKKNEWIDISGLGHFESAFSINKGVAEKDSYFVIRSDALNVGLKNYKISGRGAVHTVVEETEGQRVNRLKIQLNDIEISNPGVWRDSIRGLGLTVDAVSPPVSLIDPDPDFHFKIAVNESQLPDMQDINNLFPEKSGFKILPESHLQVSADIDIAQSAADCKLKVSGTDVGVQLNKQRIRADVEVQVLLKTEDPAMKMYTVKDTWIRFENLVLPDRSITRDEKWWMEIDISGAEFQMTRPLKLTATIGFKMKDTKPVTRFFGQSKAKWFDRYVHIKDIEGKSELKIDQDIVLNDVELSGYGLLPEKFNINGLKIKAGCKEVNFSKGWSGVNLSYELPDTKVDNLAALNEYFPETSGIAIQSGSTGTIGIDVQVKNGAGKGHLTIKGKQIKAKIADAMVKLDMIMDAGFSTRNIASGKLDITGTRMKLDNGVILNEEQGDLWWCDLNVTKGMAQIGKPLLLQMDLDLKMLNSMPFVSILKQNHPSVRWFQDSLNIHDITGQGAMQISKSGFLMRDLILNGDKLKILGDFEIIDKKFSGIFFSQFRALSLGLEIANGKSDLKLIKALKWYEEKKSGK